MYDERSEDELDESSDPWKRPIFNADPGPWSINLKTLRFCLCEIDPEALAKILRFPHSLEHFTLTQENRQLNYPARLSE
jgi:hypothetical protein